MIPDTIFYVAPNSREELARPGADYPETVEVRNKTRGYIRVGVSYDADRFGPTGEVPSLSDLGEKYDDLPRTQFLLFIRKVLRAERDKLHAAEKKYGMSMKDASEGPETGTVCCEAGNFGEAHDCRKGEGPVSG